MNRVYFRKSSTVYDENKDFIWIRFAQPRRGEKTQETPTDVVCEVNRAGELVRVIVMDHKRLHLGTLLSNFTATEPPRILSWGYVAYDEAARIATFYLAESPEGMEVEHVQRRATCHLDAQGRLVGMVIPIPGRGDETPLRMAAGTLPTT